MTRTAKIQGEADESREESPGRNRVKLPPSVWAEIDAIVEEHRGDLIPPSRSSLVTDAVVDFLRRRKAGRKARSNGHGP